MTPAEVADHLARGDVVAVRAAMDGDVRDALDEEAIRSTWTRLTDKLGPLQDVGEAVVVHDVPLILERGGAHLQVAYRGDAIAGLIVREGEPTGRFGD